MVSMITMSSEKRKYELRARASRQEETRRRIAAATSELHEEVGPARTTVAEIARRAGVQRLTVYNNFPDERDLFRACQQHWLTRHPPPDLDSTLHSAPAPDRVRAVLRELYAWYRRTERMASNIRRDRELVPALDSLMSETTDVRMAGLVDALLSGLDEAATGGSCGPFLPSRSTSGPGGGLRSRGSTMRPPRYSWRRRCSNRSTGLCRNRQCNDGAPPGPVDRDRRAAVSARDRLHDREPEAG